ncbi:protein of unknown function [Paraburkholderia dioscoreae]|uniref:Uncharacterized protein n=1 Tax=Paraburkholderia dioscoreae TaxID=2604047 RepID=A0A5Q4ZJJ9_9BURK|nr:protein of unknown function [Paraburkholderia dioscoreae]
MRQMRGANPPHGKTPGLNRVLYPTAVFACDESHRYP